MACGINIITAFLAYVTVGSVVSTAPFPHGIVTVYQYHTVVTATNQRNDSRYSSQFVLQGILDVTHDTSDPALVNAYNVVLSNVATDMHNGMTVDYDGKPVLQSVDSAASVIEQPFLIIYHTNGTVQGVKFNKEETEWSKNIKMAMATMVQLDLSNINVENLANTPNNFITQEKTIHGDCSVTYNVHPKNRFNSTSPEEFTVNKFFSPMNCDDFADDEFNNVDIEHSKDTKNDYVLSESTRNFDIVNLGDEIFIKKLFASGVVGIGSPTTSTYTQYVITNTTFEFLHFKDKLENDRSPGNLTDSPIIRDMTYRKPRASYVPNVAIDVTQGRHVVDLPNLPSQLEKFLIEANSYTDENHFNPSDVDWNRTQSINKILRTMSYMDADALQVTFDKLKTNVLPRAAHLKNIFLGVVSQVGTAASCHFTRNVIRDNETSALWAIDMLTKLPLSVKVPTSELLLEMEVLLKFNDSIDSDVKKAGILSFSSLVYKTFKHETRPEDNSILNKYLNDFFDHVKNEPTTDMKIVYLMAIRNIQVGKIYKLLKPIITGSLPISEDPERFRLLAIWTIDKAIQDNYPIALEYLWPVMVNETLSMKLRISAYEILMLHAPDQNSANKVHQYVTSKGDEHFRSYHHTNLNSIAKTSDKSRINIRTIVRSILDTMATPKIYEQINRHYILSRVVSANAFSERFRYVEKIDIRMIVNQLTGLPEVIQLENIVVDGDGAVSETAIQLHIEGCETMTHLFAQYMRTRSLTITAIVDLLKEAARSTPAPKKFRVDIILIRKGRVVIANEYSFESDNQLNDKGLEYLFQCADWSREGLVIDTRNVMFHRLSEKQLTSDIGVPVIAETRVPVTSSFYVNVTLFKDFPMPSGIVFDFKLWKHGDYSLSVYNPMNDVWHATRSVTTTEVSLPFAASFAFEADRNLRFTFPKLFANVSPVAGFFIRGKHFVTVDEDDTQTLTESCHTCRHWEDIHEEYEREDPVEYEVETFESKTTGLKFSRLNSDCEYLWTSNTDYFSNWDISTANHVENTWDVVPLLGYMHTRQMLSIFAFHAQKRNCRVIFKVEPSTENAISHIDVTGHSRYKDHDENEPALELRHAEEQTFRITLDIISSITNATAQLWDCEVHVNRNRGHSSNKAVVQITRKTAGEKDFKICINAKKNYPAAPVDDLKVGETNEEIDTQITVAAEYNSNEEECPRNETFIWFTLKAQLSDEQKNLLKHDAEHGACSEDTKNPLYASSKNLVPRTISCLQEAIRYTTPRRYNFNVTFAKIPPEVASLVDPFVVIDTESTASGNFQFGVDFLMETKSIAFQWMLNMRNLETGHIFWTDIIPGLVLKPLWDFPLDNSRFGLEYLEHYTYDQMRLCLVYPAIVLTDDGFKTPFTMPSDSWTLITGDHLMKYLAIFAKQSRPNYLSFLVFIKDKTFHFFTRENDNVLMATVNGNETLTVPYVDYSYWNVNVKKYKGHFTLRMIELPMTLLIGPNFISVAFTDKIQGRVSGLCGHFNGHSFGGAPEIYSIKNIDGY